VENGTLATATMKLKTLDIKSIDGRRVSFVNGLPLGGRDLVDWLTQFDRSELVDIICQLGES